MSLLAPLLRTDPAAPRLTVYDDARGTRMEFSAQTLDNWANKVANMLVDEFEFDADSAVRIDLPVSWQAAIVALGTYNAGGAPLDDAAATPTIVATTVDGAQRWAHVPDCLVVSDDPFGRGVVEAGGELPVGTVDFGPTVRFYGDDFFGDGASISDYALPDVGANRYWIDPWVSTAEFERLVLAPLAAGGSVVVAASPVSVERRAHIAEVEKVTHFLTAG